MTKETQPVSGMTQARFDEVLKSIANLPSRDPEKVLVPIKDQISRFVEEGYMHAMLEKHWTFSEISKHLASEGVRGAKVAKLQAAYREWLDDPKTTQTVPEHLQRWYQGSTSRNGTAKTPEAAESNSEGAATPVEPAPATENNPAA